MNGYEYASFIRDTCRELHKEISVVPVRSRVYRDGEWDTVLCHPEDKSKTDESEFTHPYRDI